MANKGTRKGHLNLKEVSTNTQKRLISAAISAVLCTVAGVGLVAALKPPTQDKTPEPAPIVAEVQTPTPPPPETKKKPEKTDIQALDTPKIEKPPPETVETVEKSPPDEVPTGKWWTRVKNKRCKILFAEGHERLVMREGKLLHDETTTYGPFLKNPVVARVRKSLNPEVTVHHIGIHPRNGRPSLAHVTLHSANGDKKGILPLQISGDQILLQPKTGQ